jgi:hypothetical protein
VSEPETECRTGLWTNSDTPGSLRIDRGPGARGNGAGVSGSAFSNCGCRSTASRVAFALLRHTRYKIGTWGDQKGCGRRSRTRAPAPVRQFREVRLASVKRIPVRAGNLKRRRRRADAVQWLAKVRVVDPMPPAIHQATTSGFRKISPVPNRFVEIDRHIVASEHRNALQATRSASCANTRGFR